MQLIYPLDVNPDPGLHSFCGHLHHFLRQQLQFFSLRIGIIYADSYIPTYDIADHAMPMLTMLASFLSSVIMNWHQ